MGLLSQKQGGPERFHRQDDPCYASLESEANAGPGGRFARAHTLRRMREART